MSLYAWENNSNGICEDAPCCGCCGPQGDGRIDLDEPGYDEPYDDAYYGYDEPKCEHCCEETSYGSTMWGSREVWYCEDCEEVVLAGPAVCYDTNNLLHPRNIH